MDVQMPELDGYEATRLIRQSSHEDATKIPIIAMTANAFAKDIQKALDAGMNAHVTKPIDINDIEKAFYKLRSTRHNN
jgi:CheY-like chemotaxis protein